MTYLIDTNVISELRKERRADAAVLKWVQSTRPEEHHTSVLVIGELRRGIEQLRRRDGVQARLMDDWLMGMIMKYSGRILPVDMNVCDIWGHMGTPNPVPVVDSFLAATAIAKGLTVVTRDAGILAMKGVKSINPFVTA